MLLHTDLSLIADGCIQQPLHFRLLPAGSVPVPLHGRRLLRPLVRLSHGAQQEPPEHQPSAATGTASLHQKSQQAARGCERCDGTHKKPKQNGCNRENRQPTWFHDYSKTSPRRPSWGGSVVRRRGGR